MAIRGTRANPTKLPVAPEGYDKRDQDHTRRLIELAFAQLGLSLQGLSSLVTPAAANNLDFLPVSPIHGMVTALGTASFPSYIQLLNPVNSGKLVVVYHLDIDYDSALTPAANILLLTGTPRTITLGNTGFLAHRDQRDVTAITSTLLGGTGGLPNLGRNSGTWELALTNRATFPYRKPYSIITEGEMPLVLLPGTALELTNVRVAVDSENEMYVLFDELPLSATVGANLPSFTGPQSSIVAMTETADTITAVSGALMMVQLFNPGPKTLKVTGLYISPHATIQTQARVTTEPATLGGTIFPLIAKRLDRRSTEAITGQLKLSTNAGPAIFPAPFWSDKGNTAGGVWPPVARVVQPFSAPIYIKPGSALEVATLSNSSAVGGCPMGVGVLWDEI